MNGENIERIERYLEGIAAPTYVCDPHRQQLRRRVLGEIAAKQAAFIRITGWKLAAAAVVLVSAAGAVGTFVGTNYRFAGQGTFGSGQGNSYVLTASDANGTADVIPVGKSTQEVDPLYQQGNLMLVRVVESEVDGRLDSRMLLCKYALAPGQADGVAQSDPNREVQTDLTSLPAAARAEISQLRRSGKGENLGTQVKEVKGRPFVFQRERFTLHNGTKITLSVGEPKEAEPAHQ